jgi:hypothetical protein
MQADLLSRIWTAPVAPQLSGPQWEVLLSQARAARLSARLARLYEQRGWMAGVPAAPRRHLESARRVEDHLRLDVRFEIDKLQSALQHVPTPVVLLKGAAYVAAGLPPADGRLFSDIDILVPHEQLRAVESALFAAGWIPEKLSPYDDRYYREWMHELPPLQHVMRRTTLDVHHTITPPTSRFAIDGAPLLARSRSLPDRPRLSVLAPADMVLHSAVHLMQDGEFSGGLRDLLDIDDLLRHFGRDAGFWPDLVMRARELGLGVTLHQVLCQIERLFGTRPPESVAHDLAAQRPGAITGRVMESLLVVALRPDHPSCDTRFTRLARWLLYVRSHWLRMPWYRIAPHLVRKAWMRALDRWQQARSPKPAGPAV